MTATQSKFDIVLFSRSKKLEEITHYEAVRAMEIARTMQEASEVHSIQVYLNHVKIHKWVRPDPPTAPFEIRT